MRCPVCKADNNQPPACRRCKADLTPLFALEAQRADALSRARQALAAGRYGAARAFAEAADGMRHDAESHRLCAAVALMTGDFTAAWRAYRELERARVKAPA